MSTATPNATTPACCAPTCCDEGSDAQMPAAAEAIRETVRENYARYATEGSGCCGPTTAAHAKDLGYTDSDLASVPDGANLGLGCGNPTAIASIQPGEVVLDLGSGAGLDALIAAERTGESGRVIGVDMTPQMLARARENAVKAGVADRVEFREGVIEQLPVVSDSVDVLISNCVINLSPDKGRVFAEAFRVLKPGGRVAVSDILLTEPLPEDIRAHAALYVGCVGGAMVADDYIAAMEDAGFADIRWTRVGAGSILSHGVEADPGLKQAVLALGAARIAAVAQTVFSYQIEARKP